MTIILPIISFKEAVDEVIEKIPKHEKVVLLYVVDREKLAEVPAAFVGTKIKKAESVIQEIKEKLSNPITDYVEWGSLVEKFESISKLENADKLLLVKDKEAEVLKPIAKAIGLKVIEVQLSD